ncbi:MAG: Verru_Chthon cassette protein D [Proteobacteria bacterium]|jgi:uncharacterized protein (TIGR02596 family)|nr:Verru_Chthon cassette protein D [Pseudomonadota bacterium]
MNAHNSHQEENPDIDPPRVHEETASLLSGRRHFLKDLPSTSGPDLRSSKFTSGFSLLELLVVIGIIVLMSSLMGPMINTALRGTKLNQAEEMVVGVLSLSRQTALTQNKTVELRLYSYKDSTVPGDTGQIHALQAFLLDDSGNYTPVMKSQQLPETVVVTTNTTLSTICTLTNTSDSLPPIPRASTNYQCYSFQFYSGGSTSLAGNSSQSNWCLTLENMLDDNGSNLPKSSNFITISIDPYNGSYRIFRPTL